MSRRKRAKADGGGAEASPPRRSRRPFLLLGLAAVAVLAAFALGAFLLVPRGGGEQDAPRAKTAVIIDQLSLTFPNPEWAARARALLANGGYHADYFYGDQVTVDFLRELPARGYDLIVFRTHSGMVRRVDRETGESESQGFIALFTNEPYDGVAHLEEQQQQRLGKSYYTRGGDALFSIQPEFIERSMKGKFDGAVILIMGCEGLRTERTAQAFLNKGASAVVSWSDSVSAEHTDAATELLLDKLRDPRVRLEDVVARTAAEMGPDPFYGAELRMLAKGG